MPTTRGTAVAPARIIAHGFVIAVLAAACTGSRTPSSPTTPPPQSCSYTVSAMPTAPFPASGSAASITIATATGCAWAATSGATWISITAGGSGSGNGQVSFSVAANNATNDRTGIITVAGQNVSVAQSGASGSQGKSYADDYPFPNGAINNINTR